LFECHFDECHSVEHHSIKCYSVECHSSECHVAQHLHYAQLSNFLVLINRKKKSQIASILQLRVQSDKKQQKNTKNDETKNINYFQMWNKEEKMEDIDKSCCDAVRFKDMFVATT
jgi:hypothetical protein